MMIWFEIFSLRSDRAVIKPAGPHPEITVFIRLGYLSVKPQFTRIDSFLDSTCPGGRLYVRKSTCPNRRESVTIIEYLAEVGISLLTETVDEEQDQGLRRHVNLISMCNRPDPSRDRG